MAFAFVLVPSSPASAVVTQGISGTVTDDGDAPLQGIEVYFARQLDGGGIAPSGSVTTDAAGKYAVQLATTGSYVVVFFDPEGDHVTEFWDDVTAFEDATAVPVTTSQVTPAISPQLATAGHITGHIEGSGGTPIAGAAIDTYQFDGQQWDYAPAYADTDANGDYDLSVAPGTYRLEFYADGYLGEFYDDAAAVEDGTSITVAAGATVSGKDAVLQKAASLGGMVTLPAGANPDDSDGDVTVVDTETGDPVGGTQLSADEETSPGSNTYPWTVTDLPAGSYRVEFGHVDGQATSEAEFYNDHPESAGPGSANPIALQAGQERTDINATLRAGGTISGTVVDDNGDPVTDCYVLAVRQGFVTRAGMTGADGSFQVGGLTTGDYGLLVGVTVPGSKCSTPEYYTNENGDLSPTPTGLIHVPAAPGSNTAIDPTLVYLGSVAPAPSVTNTTPPTVPGGAPTVGTQVTANPGTWNPADVTLSYQWRANGGVIPGATGQSYTPPAEATGLKLSVTVTASKTGYTSKSVTSNETAPVVGVSPSPTQVQNFSLPSVNGVPRVGSQLSAGTGTWTAGSTTSVQWLRNGDPVPGATGSTYTLGAADADTYIQVRVTATKPGLTPATRASTPVGPVQLGTMNLTGIPSILGTLKVGKVLRTAPPASSPAATSVRYRWFRNGVKIKGTRANDARYRLVSADRGKRISVRIKLLRPGYATSVTVVKRAGKVR
jgi:hypothetical protein